MVLPLCTPMAFKLTIIFFLADSGSCSQYNSPDLRSRSYSMKPSSPFKSRKSSANSSPKSTGNSRKTSNGSFCDTIHFLLNIPTEVNWKK